MHLRLPTLLVLLATLAGCGPGVFAYVPQVRGNRADPDKVSEITTGVSTRADVSSLLGTPTTKATFDDNTWLYISAVSRPQIAGTQSLLDQQVVAISFDDKGVVKSVEKRTEADAEKVAVIGRTTPSPGTETSFLQQLFGNIGRFSPGIGPQSSPGTNY